MYTKEKLQKLTEELGEKVSSKTATMEEVLLGTAAAHTIDFLNIAGDNRIPLSLNDQTEDNVPKVMILLHKYNMDRQLSESASREDIVKKAGGYELFSLLNGFEASGVKIEVSAIMNKLHLEHKNPDGKVVRFDIFGEFEKAMNKFNLSSRKGSFILGGTLQPFYQSLVGFLKQIK